MLQRWVIITGNITNTVDNFDKCLKSELKGLHTVGKNDSAIINLSSKDNTKSSLNDLLVKNRSTSFIVIKR